MLRNEYSQIGESTFQTLQSSEEEESFEIYGYKSSLWKSSLIILLNIGFLGVPYIVSCWYPRLKTIYYKESLLKDASKVYIRDKYGTNQLLHVHENVQRDTLRPMRHFSYRYTKYVWVSEQSNFVPVDDLVDPVSTENLLQKVVGLYHSDALRLLELYGANKIEVEIKSYWRLFVEEIFHPFYLFQVFSIALWCVDDYMIYAGCVLVLSLFSTLTSLIQTRKQSMALHNLIESSSCEHVDVLRSDYMAENNLCKIDTSDLVPGDILVIPRNGCVLPCDAVMLTGICIVNESSLTGESVPITKTPPHPSQEIYKTSTHRRHTLFAGTTVIQSRYYGGEYVMTLVVKTGFSTTKGALVKSILYPTPVGLKFYKDSLKFILFLFSIAICGMAYCMYLYVKRKADVGYVIMRALDIFTIVVPPALPAAMSMGTSYSQDRLKKLGIYCISPPRINVCGKIKLACFDKTGTLTHEGLDLYCVVHCNNGQIGDVVTDTAKLDHRNLLTQAMATCHSLTRINGALNGDPLDLNMFASTGWELEEPGEDEDTRYDMLVPTIVKPRLARHYEIGVIRQFTFSSSQQCMSVICRELQSSGMIVFTKGAPEKLHGMCRSDSLPSNFTTYLSNFTAQGFRCIAAAYKPLPNSFKWMNAQKATRDQIENDLIFLGFIMLRNTLKPETLPIIRTLHNANIRTVMITGDNVMTAVSVARDCEMVQSGENIVLIETARDQNCDNVPRILLENIGDCDIRNVDFTDNSYYFAMDGRTFDKLHQYYPDVLPMVLLRTKVFARFQPDQKMQLVLMFQELDFIVSMVGDGANDCGALKAAHVGVSLSQAEASVAAPFTSSVDNISCILHLILEGRCALVTSFAIFKYMTMYSLIQFFTVLILYQKHSILGDMQFLFIDLIITTSLAVTIGLQGPENRLARKRPMGSLVSTTNLIPLTLQILICASIQVGALVYLMRQPWFEPTLAKKDETIVCWENTVLFTVSCFQYVILACVYSKGRPHRQSLMHNHLLLLCAVVLSAFVVYLVACPSDKVANFFEILPLHHDRKQLIFRYSLLILPLAHVILASAVEVFVADSGWFKTAMHFVFRKKHPKNRFKRLELNSDFVDWLQSERIVFQSRRS